MKRSIIFLAVIFLTQLGFAHTSPTHLTTGLLEHTDRFFFDGYPANIPLSEIDRAVEHYQLAAIRNPRPCLD
jgi:hypothetical protein